MTACPDTTQTRPAQHHQIARFIAADTFPCVGAKSALNKHRIQFFEFDTLGDASQADVLCRHLEAFSSAYPDPGANPVSLVAVFKNPMPDELSFEAALWRHLQAMHDVDRERFDWDPSVSNQPSSKEFSFSIAGRAFFVVGLHPAASRASRRAPFPALVFNFHNQFEHLKATGKYQSMQVAIRKRDVQLQGAVNPVLARFGESSEARQYSGRNVDETWGCPFHAGGQQHV